MGALRKARPAAARAVMASRVEARGSDDFFPTPPWATRALCAEVLGLAPGAALSVWEPACGEGHMAVPLMDFFAEVVASDLHDRGFSPLHGSKWDFLSLLPQDQFEPGRFDWIITNPPFGDLPQQFVERAFLHRPRVGVAMFVPLRWLETIARAVELFIPFPPHVVAVFAERVALTRGGWDPDAGTATAYCWVVWRMDGAAARPLQWIVPGAAKRHSRAVDLTLVRARCPQEAAGPLFEEIET